MRVPGQCRHHRRTPHTPPMNDVLRRCFEKACGVACVMNALETEGATAFAARPDRSKAVTLSCEASAPVARHRVIRGGPEPWTKRRHTTLRGSEGRAVTTLDPLMAASPRPDIHRGWTLRALRAAPSYTEGGRSGSNPPVLGVEGPGSYNIDSQSVKKPHKLIYAAATVQ